MGLDVMVGVSAEELEGDESIGEWRVEAFEAVNTVLKTKGIRLHVEPEALQEERCYSERIGSYGTIHYLRRLAAHLELGRVLPPPLARGDDAADDPILKRRYEITSPRSRFAHLLEHSDVEGFYLPIDFAEVISDESVTGAYIGSSFALRRECEELARAIGVPLDLDKETEELYEGGDGSRAWHAYHVEARTCLVLHRAAVTSIETGAAIVFG